MTSEPDPQNPELARDQAAADFRMRYYGPDNNPEPPEAMEELAPEIMRLVDSVVYGEIYNRPAVDLKTRSLCTIAALVVLGHSPEMIKRHITGALHIGVSKEEITEIIGQMLFYGGMPAGVRAFRIAKETFDEQQSGTNERRPGPPFPGRGVSETVRYRPRTGPGLEPDVPVTPGEQPGGQARPSPRPSDVGQPDQGRPPADRPRPATRGRNQPPGSGRRSGPPPKGGRGGPRGGANATPRASGRRGGGGPGRKRNPGGRG